MSNLLEYARVFVDGGLWVVVQPMMPHQSVRLGVGDSLREAYDASEASHLPVQSVGLDSGVAAALRWANDQGWISDPDELVPVEGAVLSGAGPVHCPRPG